MPGTLLGVSGWPASTVELVFGPWNYWWQAHLLDCLVDAYVRSPDQKKLSLIERQLNGIRIRAFRSWLNDYYDDMAWLALAVQRAEKYAGVRRPAALPALTEDIRSGWTDLSGGGVWWRKPERFHDDFKNVPTNGPAAIMFARQPEPAGTYQWPVKSGPNRERARDSVNWIERHLIDRATGLVYDGLHVNEDGSISGIEATIYTYCQGVFLGACVELALRDKADDADSAQWKVWAGRAVRTVEAVAAHVTDLDDAAGPALRGQGGGDGGLFAGILARYLGLAAKQLPTLGPAYQKTANLAADLVFSSAEAAWRNRTETSHGPLFGPDWTTPAAHPGRASSQAQADLAERDLSVQLSGWMLMEIAADLHLGGIGPSA
ncbi:MAG TPA: glycoside hydrolase family 76 protein [Actinocrinis sp.]|nr:glycoside hydrolase family 76 protein [Actinocrinis sp.]